MKILGSFSLFVIFTITFFLFIYLYSKILNKIPKRYKVILLFLRTTTIFFLLILLINPWIQFSRDSQYDQNIDVIFDHSYSMNKHYLNEGIDIFNIIEKIEKWGINNNLNIDFFKLGNASVDKYEKNNIYTNFTDFSGLEKYILFNNPDQFLLFTDGIATKGKELIDLSIPKFNIGHIIGVGPSNKEIDIKIQSLEYPLNVFDNDTVKILIKIRSFLNENVNRKITILNGSDKIIYNNTIEFNEGDNINDFLIRLPANYFLGLNKVIIDPLLNENNTINNKYFFNINIESSIQDLMFISGSLSLNSRLINNILDNLEGVNVNHYFKINKNKWNKSIESILNYESKLIILDDFPSNSNDEYLFNEIYNKASINQIPIIYIEGPKSNLNSAEIIRKNVSSLKPLPISADHFSSLANESQNNIPFLFDFSNFPPQKRTVQWNSDSRIWKKYSDGSIFLFNDNNFTLVSIPDLSTSYNKLKSVKLVSSHNFIKNMFLYTINKQNGLLRLNTNKSDYNVGESLTANLKVIDGVEILDFKLLIINNNDTLISRFKLDIFSDNYISNQYLAKYGKYEIIAQAQLSSGDIVNSNKIEIVVQDINVEYKNLIKDQNQLQRVSKNYGGKYVELKSLDSLLNNIDVSHISINKKHQISSISLQYYWWIIVILLCIEWYYRKKLGYL